MLATISLVWFTPELVPRIEELGAALRDAGLQISAELGFRIPRPLVFQDSPLKIGVGKSFSWALVRPAHELLLANTIVNRMKIT